MTIYALWNGGHGNYGDADLMDDVERFETVQDAENALRDRYENDLRHHRFDFVNRLPESVMTPTVGTNCYMDVYLALDIEAGTGNVLVHDNGPDLRITIDRDGNTTTDRG